MSKFNGNGNGNGHELARIRELEGEQHETAISVARLEERVESVDEKLDAQADQLAEIKDGVAKLSAALIPIQVQRDNARFWLGIIVKFAAPVFATAFGFLLAHYIGK